MNNILKFNKFITEKLGIVEGLEEIADMAVEALSTDDNFELKTRIRNKNVTIHFIIDKNLSSYGRLTINDSNKFDFTIRIKNQEKKSIKSIIVHELKHVDRAIVTTLKLGRWSDEAIANHISDFLSGKYKHLFNEDVASEIFETIIYISDPNEFESNFNQFYIEIKDMIENGMTKEERRKIVNDYLNNEDIYRIYNFIYKRPFNMKDFFPNNKNINVYLKKYKKVLDDFKKRIPGSVTNIEILKSKINSIVGKFTKDDESTDKLYQDINNMVNKNILKNYKKFGRLYTLFDC